MKQMNITEWKQNYRSREDTNGYQEKEGREEAKLEVGGLRGTSYNV